jgi:hypothetical protein
MRLLDERVNDGAFRGGIAGAPGDGFRQDVFDPLKVRDLRPNVSQMVLGDRLNLGAGLRPVIDQPQQPANFFQRKAEITGPHDEFQPSDMDIILASVAFCSARRVRHDAGRLVISDGFKVAACGTREIDPPKRLHGSVIHFPREPLEPVSPTALRTVEISQSKDDQMERSFSDQTSGQARQVGDDTQRGWGAPFAALAFLVAREFRRSGAKRSSANTFPERRTAS